MNAARAVIVLASAGRPEVLRAAIVNARQHDGVPVIVAVPDAASAPADIADLGVTLLITNRGLTRQRNAALAHISEISPDTEFVVFFDDDSITSADWVAEAIDYFDQHRAVVGLTGRLLADGVRLGHEITVTQAEQLIAAADPADLAAPLRPASSLYGCNFAIRRAASVGLQFDERLPLYGWLEDLDFSGQLARNGLLHFAPKCVGVHRGCVSGGRTAHLRLGYSQVANPHWLVRKGTVPLGKALLLALRPALANIVKSIAGKGRGDRRDRLRGNLMAVRDWTRRRLAPERILQIHR